MSFAPGNSKLSMWSGNALSSLTQSVKSLLGLTRFTPEETLTEAKNIDPRLVPKVPMQSADIDTNLLIELSKLGMKHGKLVTEQSHPELTHAWKTMSARAGLKRAPQLIIVESKIVNAMTVSPEEVVVTTALLKKLDLRETCAVLGHELGHANSDHKTPRLVATGIFSGLGAFSGFRLWQRRFGKGMPLTPSNQLLAAVSESFAIGAGAIIGGVFANQISVKPTELQADLKGAAISGDPQGLISALHKLESGRIRNPIINVLAYLHSGYPTTGQRIQNLQTVAAHMPPQVLAPALAVNTQSRSVPVQPIPQVTSVAADERLEAQIAPQYSVN